MIDDLLELVLDIGSEMVGAVVESKMEKPGLYRGNLLQLKYQAKSQTPSLSSCSSRGAFRLPSPKLSPEEHGPGFAAGG